MMKLKGLFLTVSLIALVVCCCSCTAADSPDYVSFDALPDGYGTEEAIADDCVVFEDLQLTSGQDIWKAFLKNAEKGQSCRVRIANYFGESDSLSLIDLSYQDGSFRMDANYGVAKSYKYLNHYEFSADDGTSIECYILVNQEDLTYREIEQSMTSSMLGAAIDHYNVYFHAA